ncbi:MAG: adenylate/guanylate cyclase domain-containing protein [Spirochaetota bacterium]
MDQDREVVITGNPLPREGLITALRTLGKFHDEEVHKLLIEYFFHPDPVVSMEALRSSGCRMNEAAVPHLLRIIEGGSVPQKVEALKTLSCIDAPHVIENLLKYFSLFTEHEVQQELLRAMNAILPFQEKIIELNRGVLTSNAEDIELCKIAVRGLVNTEDFSFLKLYILHAPAAVQEEVFRAALKCGGREVATFLKKLENDGENFSEKIRGVYLGAYFLKVPNPSMHYSMKAIQRASRETYCAFLDTLLKNVDCGGALKDIFRFLLLLPYTGEDVEILISELIKKIIELAEKKSSVLVGELRSITGIHLERVFKRVRDTHISLNKIQKKEDLLPTLLAHLLGKYSSEALILEVQNHFRGDKVISRKLIESLGECLKGGGKTALNGFKATLPLFYERDVKKRRKVAAIVNTIDPEISHHLRRLNRLVKACGFLGVENQSRKVYEVLSFAVQEKITYLQEASVITLCQLNHRNFIAEVEGVLKQPSTGRNILKSYIHGAQYLPPEVVSEPLVGLLFRHELDMVVKDMIVESLDKLELANPNLMCSRLLKALELDDISPSQRRKIGEMVSDYPEAVSFQSLFDAMNSGDELVKTIVLEIIRNIVKNKNDWPLDVLTGKLYSLLDYISVPVKVEALFTLLALGDDYAERVAGDWIEAADEPVICEMLSLLKEESNDLMLVYLPALLRSDKVSIQEILREVLSSIACGPCGKKLRDLILSELKGGSKLPLPGFVSEEKGVLPVKGELFLHPKIEFRLKREHSQNLTVFFIDMVGYTEKSIRSDATKLLKLIKAFEENVLPTIDSYNGHIVKKLGDGILAVFKHPVNAAIAALEIQGKIGEYNRYTVNSDKFQVRIGMHSGDVLWKDDDIFGDVVNIASRIETSAAPGEILITEDTYSEIRDCVICDPRGELQVKGIERPIHVFTPRGVSRDVKALLDIKKSNVEALIKIEDGEVAKKLREAFFSPRFELPGGYQELTGSAGRVTELLRGLFRDLAQATSAISNDYREEFLFKRYLQEKWNEVVGKLGESEKRSK